MYEYAATAMAPSRSGASTAAEKDRSRDRRPRR